MMAKSILISIGVIAYGWLASFALVYLAGLVSIDYQLPFFIISTTIAGLVPALILVRLMK